MKDRAIFALAFVPTAFAAGGFAARSLLARPPPAIAVDLEQPLVVVTAWRTLGAELGGLLVAVVLAASLAFALTRLQPFPSNAPRQKWIGAAILSAGLALAACLTWPVVFSSDVYAYAAYGELARDGLNPYQAPPPDFHGSFVTAARWQWGGSLPVCVYGPGFVGIAASIVTLPTGHKPAATLFVLRVLGAAALLIGALLLARLVDPAQRWAATAAFVMNPTALWTAAEGHNDALLVLVVLAGLLLARRARTIAGLALGLSLLLKAPGAIAAVIATRFVGDARARRAYLVGAGLGLTIALALALPWQLGGLAAISGHGRYEPQFSLQALVGVGPGLAAAAAFAVAGIRLTLRGEREGLLWLAVGLWLAIPNPYPWYSLWLLPVAAIFTRHPIGAGLWLVTICSVLRYLPDAVVSLGSGASALVTLAELAPLAVALAAYGHPAHSSQKAAVPS